MITSGSNRLLQIKVTISDSYYESLILTEIIVMNWIIDWGRSCRKSTSPSRQLIIDVSPSSWSIYFSIITLFNKRYTNVHLDSMCGRIRVVISRSLYDKQRDRFDTLKRIGPNRCFMHEAVTVAPRREIVPVTSILDERLRFYWICH